jgi:hypothetical protein
MTSVSSVADAGFGSPAAIVSVALIILTLTTAGIWAARRDRISGAKEVTDAALLLIKPQSERISALTDAVTEMSESIDVLKRLVVGLEQNVKSLSEQIVALGHTPVLPYRFFPTTNNKDI